MFPRLTAILIMILCSAVCMADTVDYDAMSRMPARKLFDCAAEYLAHQQEDTAIVYYIYAIGVCEKENDSRNASLLAKSYNELGKCHYIKGDYVKAFDAFLKAAKLCDQYGFGSLLPHIYNNMGSIYSIWNDTKTGTHYFKRALAATDSTSQHDLYVKVLINIIGNNCRDKKVKEAWKYYGMLSSIDMKTDLISYFVLVNKGLILVAEERNPEAISYIREAARYAGEKQLDFLYEGYAYSTLGSLYESYKPDSALYFYHKAMNSSNPPYLKRGILKNLARIYRSINSPLADEYDRRYLLISDSLFNEEEINKTRSSQFLYESERNFQEMMRLGEEEKARKEELRRQRKTIFISFAALAIFMVMLIIVCRKQVTLNRAYRDLFKQNKERITREQDSKEKQQEMTLRISELMRELDAARHRLSMVSEAVAGETQADVVPDHYITDNPVGSDKNGIEQDSDNCVACKLQSADKLSVEKKNEIRQAVESVIDRGEEIYNCDFSIESLADIIGYNSKYISKVINETYGCNFRTFINDIRIRESQRRLLDMEHYGSLTISAVAHSVGYKSHANFILLFKRQTGLSPSAFQKLAREEK